MSKPNYSDSDFSDADFLDTQQSESRQAETHFSNADPDSLTPVTDVARQLQTDPYVLRQWSRKFGRYLSNSVNSEYPRFNRTDVITLTVVQTLLLQGFSDEQVQQHLAQRQNGAQAPSQPSSRFQAPAGMSSAAGRSPATETTKSEQFMPARAADTALPSSLQDIFSAIADNQRTVLSNQASVREIVGVVVQDNFNLKDENRKLRDRMLKLERVLAEYQRREELRKERLESRLRALETTTGGLQQQIAQLVQIIRKKKRGIFG